MLLDLFRYFFHAKNAHGIHSPFVFEFYNEVLNAHPIYFDDIENLREEQAENDTIVNITDFGAGSRYTNNNQRTIASLTTKSAKSKKWAALLFRIIEEYQYNDILELGTSLGFTTSYLAKTNRNVTTMEGCEETLDWAKKHFEELKLTNIHTICGNIDTMLPVFLATKTNLDFVLFDANHQYEPTLRYFTQCLTKINKKSCFVFDDIYWSPEMKKAWFEIKNHPSVTVSIDLFYIGIVFFDPKLSDQNFILRW